jgi:hypothetical protein
MGHGFGITLMTGDQINFVTFNFAFKGNWLFFSTTPVRN